MLDKFHFTVRQLSCGRGRSLELPDSFYTARTDEIRSDQISDNGAGLYVSDTIKTLREEMSPSMHTRVTKKPYDNVWCMIDTLAYDLPASKYLLGYYRTDLFAALLLLLLTTGNVEWTCHAWLYCSGWIDHYLELIQLHFFLLLPRTNHSIFISISS